MVIVPMIVMIGMAMRMAAMGVVGAASGLERLADLGNRRTEPFEHGTDHVIAQNEDTFLFDLRREMAIAKMPGKLDQMPAIARPDFE